MSEESEVKQEQVPPSDSLSVASTSSSTSSETSSFTTATTTPSTAAAPGSSEPTTVTSSTDSTTTTTVTSTQNQPSPSAGLMITRSATIKPDVTLQPDSEEAMDTTKSEASSITKTTPSSGTVTRTSSREPSVPTPTMKTRTSGLGGGNGAANTSSSTPSTPTMKTRHSNRVTTPKSLGNTTSLTVGGRAMSTPSTPVTLQSQEDSLIKRRSSSRSIKRKKFDDELVESSLVKSTRGGKVPPSPLTPGSMPSTTTQHHSPTPSKPSPEPQSTPKPQPSPPSPQPVKEEVVKVVEEKKEKAQPKAVEMSKPSPPPPPPPKKTEVHVPKKPKIETAVTPKPKPTPSAPRQSKTETLRPAPEKRKGKALDGAITKCDSELGRNQESTPMHSRSSRKYCARKFEAAAGKPRAGRVLMNDGKKDRSNSMKPSKSSSSKSSRSKKSKSIVPLARETSRWTAEDDLALITAIHQTNDLEQVFQGVKFSHRFSMKEIEERWYALLYDPIASKASQTAMRLLHPDIKIAIMSQALYSEEEEKVLGTITSTSLPTVDTFQELINKNGTIFNPMRTAKGLQTHWMTMKQYHLLPDQTVQPMPRGDHVLNFSDAEDMMDDSQLQDPRDEILEHELAAFDRRQKRQIRHLEDEIPKWQVLVENVTGMPSQEFDSQTLAVLRGRLVRYLMRSKEITIGRSSKDNTIDVDLSLEGPAWKVSRKQGIIKLRNNGEFYLANEGKRAVHIDGKPVLKGQKWKLTNNSVVEIAGLRFIFLVNQDVISTLRTEPMAVK
ncbi:microspherule protein 1-like isoform X1 [Lytechinus variegatus]|uniref:microspherule protein 1-like isoform X1 n=1 Tax=Lytechinus variegatus TaxID=7654 RepID=UPI001BB1B3D5|nr:microspherule protein 1-like isoform X1 [Lytechinus variegatus]